MAQPDPGRAARTAGQISALAALVLGDRTGSRAVRDGGLAALCQLADAHGVLPLIAENAAASGLPDDWWAALQGLVRRRAAADLVRERELRALAVALREADVAALVVKGAHLAYAVYGRPDLRPRIDTDLLVSAEGADRADQVLRREGYHPVPQLSADLVMYQRSYEKRHGQDVAHVVDLHWRFSNPQRFGNALIHADVLARARPIAALCPEAIGPSRVDALLIACVHRIAHHLDVPRLIWSHDIHLIATALDTAEWCELAALARARQVSRACERGLASARQYFGTVVPTAVAGLLAADAARETSMDVYLDADRPHMSRILQDLRTLGSRQVLRVARQHVLPSPAYMRGVYAPASHAPLPWLYATRVWRGARRWFGR